MILNYKQRIMGAICAGLCVITIYPMFVMAADDKGCWSGRHSGGSCLTYNTYVKNNKTYFKLTNICDERLYIKWCAGNSCGVDGLRAGQTKTQYEYRTNTRNLAWAIGSNTPSHDWTCKDRIGGW